MSQSRHKQGDVQLSALERRIARELGLSEEFLLGRQPKPGPEPAVHVELCRQLGIEPEELHREASGVKLSALDREIAERLGVSEDELRRIETQHKSADELAVEIAAQIGLPRKDLFQYGYGARVLKQQE